MEQRQNARTKLTAFAALLAVIVLLAACVYGCAPKESSEPADAQESSETTIQGDFSFSTDADCAICHETQNSSMSNTACAASNHAAQTCIDCHSDVDGLTKAHDGVAYGDKAAKRLKTTEVDETTCLTDACHQSYEALAEKTASSTVLTDSEGTVVNPHAMPENEDHETIDCGSCHSLHSEDPIEDTAQKACQSCHHMGIYECYTCHE